MRFAEQPGAVVSKEALMSAVWPGVIVEENNLAKAVSTLRRALIPAV
jgi:DNA-binding winged helix-turn-helix (wHTH) protein